MRATPGHVHALRHQHHRLSGAARWLAAAALGCLLGACGGGGSKTSTTPTGTASFKTLLDAGIYLLRQGNTVAAEQLFQQAIAKNPQDPVAHYDLGVAYQGAGDRRDALRQYNQALHANSHYVPALYNEATLTAPVNAPLAIFYYHQVIAMQPDSPTALLNLGLLENQTKSLRAQAVKDFKRAVRLDPTLRSRVPASLRGKMG